MSMPGIGNPPRRAAQHLARTSQGTGTASRGAVWETHRARPGARTSSVDEREQVGVDHVAVRRVHAVRIAWIDLQRAVRAQPILKDRRVVVGHDLIVITALACLTSVGTVIAFKSSVWSVSEKAFDPFVMGFRLPSFPDATSYRLSPCENLRSGDGCSHRRARWAHRDRIAGRFAARAARKPSNAFDRRAPGLPLSS